MFAQNTHTQTAAQLGQIQLRSSTLQTPPPEWDSIKNNGTWRSYWAFSEQLTKLTSLLKLSYLKQQQQQQKTEHTNNNNKNALQCSIATDELGGAER